MRRFCKNARQFKGEAGTVVVLHTYLRRLDVHLVMPGASLDAKSRRWRTKTGYLFNHRALAKAFRGKLLAALKAAGLSLPSPLPQKWVVDCKSVGNGDKALVYLGRYLYRGIIREADLLSCDEDCNGKVSFRYQDSRCGETKVRTLPDTDFLHMLHQHVLPKGRQPPRRLQRRDAKIFRRKPNLHETFMICGYPICDGLTFGQKGKMRCLISSACNSGVLARVPACRAIESEKHGVIKIADPIW